MRHTAVPVVVQGRKIGKSGMVATADAQTAPFFLDSTFSRLRPDCQNAGSNT
jgi:hypothetical protein